MKTLYINISHTNIDDVIARLYSFRDEWLDKIDELVALMTEKGEEVAITYVGHQETGDTAASISDLSKVTGGRHKKTGFIIAGEAAIFLEFGTGVCNNPGEPYPEPRPSGVVGIGEYGHQQGSTGDAWVYYDRKHHMFRVTKGIAARMFMWRAAQSLRNEFPEFVRSIFK